MKAIGKKPKLEPVDRREAMERLWKNNQVIESNNPPKEYEKKDQPKT